jgi:hypothetical protein
VDKTLVFLAGELRRDFLHPNDAVEEDEGVEARPATVTGRWWRAAAQSGAIPVAGYENEGVKRVFHLMELL